MLQLEAGEFSDSFCQVLQRGRPVAAPNAHLRVPGDRVAHALRDRYIVGACNLLEQVEEPSVVNTDALTSCAVFACD